MDDDKFGRFGSSGRLWRSDRGAMLSGVCAGLAEDLDLPLPLLRVVGVIFLVLPTGLAYLALSLLLRRRPAQARSSRSHASSGFGRPSSQSAEPSAMARSQSLILLAHRFEALEPRLKRIEAFVSSNEFELHGGFRRMGD